MIFCDRKCFAVIIRRGLKLASICFARLLFIEMQQKNNNYHYMIFYCYII